MASAHSLAGLMKWLRREEWQDAFSDLLDLHLGAACAKADVSIEEMSEIVGDDHATVLWGCVFEDFLTRHMDGGRNARAVRCLLLRSTMVRSCSELWIWRMAH